MNEENVLEALYQAHKANVPVALATIVRTQGSMPRHVGTKMLIYSDGKIVGTIGGGAMESRVIQDGLAALADGQPRLLNYRLNNLQDGDPGICGGNADIYIEPYNAPPTLVVIGCGHVGKALAELGKWLGFRVIVSDDRAELCSPDHIPNMDGYLVAPPSQVASQIPLTPQTYIAAVTRGLPVDEQLFPPLLSAPVPYIGLIGSRRRWALTVKALEERGLSREQIARVRAPIGLELNAETPREIALSIMAEIVMLRNGGDGKPMQWIGTLQQAEAQ
ncbi:MAG: xanthine dehydrogenase [Candidatus Thermofonsia Clade 1 bacterium]|uniref:Xanthine dehydrogenase n=1 Tax=Candidatus Thermofonsia Clade 1 bacterium TaxID=2364210 RepID=A0A2M8PD06_9CHLR|nr:MAG: xanthine dehydrogenase [Candidatus Thermofonsia Clade 1 bacterium]RMF53145.1 MAG: XdhC family protein [Chloroflexota bacterium]